MFPSWEVPYITGGLVIAIMATFHILPSHLSTSGMWFNIWAELKSIREGRKEFREFISKYTLAILVFAYVFGSLSGIGIWFATMTASPRAISALIHNYVWGWATEWVFFIIEVLGIFVYYYTLDKVDERTHLKIGIIFAIASWTTMVIIVGILSFMLSPGKWLQTGNFFAGFFNQTYWTQLLTRTGFMFAIAGIYALIVLGRVKDEKVKGSVAKLSSIAGLLGIVATFIFGSLYIKTLPSHAKDMLSTEVVVSRALKAGTLIPVALVFIYFVFSAIKPLSVRTAPSVIMMIVLFIGIWNAERIRESIRKPFTIPHYMTSSQIIVEDMKVKGVESELKKVEEAGFVKSSPFIPDNLNDLEKGRAIALYQCNMCHTLNRKGLRPLPSLLERLGIEDEEELASFLESLGNYPYMPPFAGNETDRLLLARFLIKLKGGRQ